MEAMVLLRELRDCVRLRYNHPIPDLPSYCVCKDKPVYTVVGFIRRRLRFDLLRTCVIALRGFKKNAAPEKIEDLEFNLRPVAANY